VWHGAWPAPEGMPVRQVYAERYWEVVAA
jgi:hypothetical protein